MYRDAAYADNHELADVLEQVQLHDTPKTLKAKFTVENGYTQETADFVADLDYTKLTGVDVDGKEIPLGRIYKVGLTPKPDDLLDYDKPLSQQPKKYKAALNEIANIQGIPVVDQFGQSASFGSFQDALSQKVGPENAMREFFEAGIPGIKYLDRNSRNSGAGSTNYVIFDDSMIKILEKYGIVGPVAISAMALSEDES